MSKDLVTGDIVTNYIFKIDNCLDISVKAGSFEDAKFRAERGWPRSKVEFVREEFSHIVEDLTHRHIPIKVENRKGVVVRSSQSKPAPISVEDRLTSTIASTFAGAA